MEYQIYKLIKLCSIHCTAYFLQSASQFRCIPNSWLSLHHSVLHGISNAFYGIYNWDLGGNDKSPNSDECSCNYKYEF